jgi:hypothetical protein
LLESFGKSGGSYAACCVRVEDLEARAEGVEERWRQGCVCAGAAGWTCWAGGYGSEDGFLLGRA